MKEYKIALALDSRTLKELLDKGFHDFFGERERKGMFRTVNTPDDWEYKVLLWDWETPDPDKWESVAEEDWKFSSTAATHFFKSLKKVRSGRISKQTMSSAVTVCSRKSLAGPPLSACGRMRPRSSFEE